MDEIRIEDIKKHYDESKQEIINITELNAVEKDHILLILLDSISDYYLSNWKNEVLINGGTKVESYKKMKMVVFYQCMGQELYKDRYPKMRVRYTFSEVITALIHFSMFGWEEEEEALFDFIVSHICGNIMNVNDWSKHTWFLLELYLQYKNKTVMEINQNMHLALRKELKEKGLRCDLIPEDLGVYKEVLDQWSTPKLENISNLIGKMSQFHSELASDLGQSIEFSDFVSAFYPYEILFLIHVRNKMGLPVPKHFNDFLMNTPEARMNIQDPDPYPDWDPLLRNIDNFYRKNYPNYIPNERGELFQ